MFSPMFNLSLVKPCFFHDFLIILLCKLALRKAREHHAFEACDMFVEESGGHLRWVPTRKAICAAGDRDFFCCHKSVRILKPDIPPSPFLPVLPQYLHVFRMLST